VEIIAICAAGVWAIYVFIYTDRIEPYQKPLAPVADATMTVEGMKGDLIAVRISQSIKNLGPGRLHVLGRVANVIGDSVRMPDNRDLRTTQSSPPLTLVQKRFRFNRFEGVFTYIDEGAIWLDSGATFSYSSIVYVPRDRYDALVLDSDFVYNRNNDSAQITLTRNRSGVPIMSAPNSEGTSTEIQTSLWR